MIYHRGPRSNAYRIYLSYNQSSLEKEAIKRQITHESFEEFKARVLQTMDNTSTEVIDRTIDSMWNRIEDVIKGIGNRTKY